MNKLPFEFKAMLTGFAISALMLMTLTTGCTNDLLNSRTKTTTVTVPTNGPTVTVIVENDVLFFRYSLLASSVVNNADIKWGDVQIALGHLSTTGDTATTKVLTDGIVAGLIAYATGGASAVAPAVAKLVPADKVQPVTDAVLESVKVKETTPAVKPEAAKVNTAADVAPGKNAVVIIGNRAGCPLCRALWSPTFEADAEKALVNADIVDADLTDNHVLYKKYFSSDCTVYPYAIVFDATGKRLGAFAVRGAAKDNFIGEVEKLCPDCKPAK